MEKKQFMTGLAALPLVATGTSLLGQTGSQSDVEQIIAALKARQLAKQATPADWVALQLKQLPEAERASAAFAVVQSVPYRISRWTGDPDSLFGMGRGDCRHKAFGQMRLFKALGLRVRHVKTRFDWADLPIPAPVLNNLSVTLGVHDSVAVQTGADWVIVDATWDPKLARLGFPVAGSWDGRSQTRPITQGSLRSIFADEMPKGTNPYELLSVPWPIRSRTQAFSRALNGWLNQKTAA